MKFSNCPPADKVVVVLFLTKFVTDTSDDNNINIRIYTFAWKIISLVLNSLGRIVFIRNWAQLMIIKCNLQDVV